VPKKATAVQLHAERVPRRQSKKNGIFGVYNFGVYSTLSIAHGYTPSAVSFIYYLKKGNQISGIEVVVTVSVGLVWSGQHLAHNAQRHNAPAHSTHYFAITMEEKKNITIR
jgi:hypothetical protein